MTAQVWELLAVVAVPGLTIWLWRAIYRPMAPCRWCGGRKKVGDRERWRNRECWRCGNTGERMTWGGRVVRGVSRSGRWGR